MAYSIDLTPGQPARITLTTALGEQSVSDAVEVGHCDVLDLELVVVEAPSGVNLTFTLSTGLQRDSTDGWVDGAVSADQYDFAVLGGTGTTARRFSAGLLRFVRWKLRSSSSYGGQTVVFYVRGLGRTFGAGGYPP